MTLKQNLSPDQTKAMSREVIAVNSRGPSSNFQFRCAFSQLASSMPVKFDP